MGSLFVYVMKLALFLIAAAIGWFQVRKKLNRQAQLLFIGVAVLMGLAANTFSGYLPTVMDVVTLTALGEK